MSRLNKEVIRYLITGIFTTLASLSLYFLLSSTVLDPDKPLEMQTANLISWSGAVAFSYIVSRKFVFSSKNRHILREAGAFFLARIGTLFLDMGGMFILTGILSIDDRISKLFIQAVVIVLNYILNKYLVFAGFR